LISTTFTDARERVRALALLSGVASAGFAIGLIVGGLLTQVGSWRWVLFINVPFGVAAVVLDPRYIREPGRHPARLDLPGAITGTAGMAAVVYALTHAATAGWSDRPTEVALGCGVVLLAVFLGIELRAAQPIVPLRLFADRNRGTGFLSFLLGAAAMMSMFFFLTQFLQVIRGFSALATGFAFLPLALGMFAMTRVVPRLLPRLGPKPLVVTGCLVMIVGLAWLTRISPDSGYFPALFGPMVLMGLGGGLGFVPLTPVIMATVPPKDAGSAGGVLQTMQQTGATLGLAVLVTVSGTAMRHAAQGGATARDALVHGMTEAFTASTIIAVGALLVALTFRRQHAGRVPTAGAPPVQAAGAGSAAAEADEGARRLNGRGGGQRNGRSGAAGQGAVERDHHAGGDLVR
jgi:MFS family permease